MPAPDPSMDPKTRDAQLEDFELLGQVGSGGFGTVYQAKAKRDLKYAMAGDLFAIKVYHAGTLDEPTAKERVEREFRTGLILRHQNLVKFFQLSISVPRPFLVMELCDGDNLIHWREKNRQPTGDFILQF